MSKGILDIISFNVPHPPNYGGVIDVYYKLISLKKSGFEIILHTFLYDRNPSPELEEICKKVYYYKRRTGFTSLLHFIPYISFSRRSDDLLNNLELNEGPILFEGLHSCFYLNNKALRKRLKIVRTHNIEHEYYFHLFKSEKSIQKRLFFLSEAIKLKSYQGILKNASSLAVISENDKEHFKRINKETFLLHPFHSNSKIESSIGKGSFYLYHGNLEVPENIQAVWFLIANVFSKLNLKLVIAGKNPEPALKSYIESQSNFVLVENPTEDEMNHLISDAHAIVLYTQQSTGVKLKLLESLYKGRFCIANSLMTAGTGLEDLCLPANTASDYISQIEKIAEIDFTTEELKKREKLLEDYLPEININNLIQRFGNS